MSKDHNWPELAAAKAMGLSYGKYKALMYNPSEAAPKAAGTQKRNRKRQKRYSEQAAFLLWQQGKTDPQIASILGVSHTIIWRWRDTLELPSHTKQSIDTKKYRLLQAEDGTFFAICEDNQTISAKLIEK